MTNKEEFKQKLIENGFDCYILYLVTGDETSICNRLNRRYPGAYFLTLRRMMHRSKDGKKWNEEDLLIKRYIFVYVEKNVSMRFLSEIGSLLYINDCDDKGKLVGENFEFANWVLKIDGLLGISKAIMKDGLVKITDGPLHEMEDKIVKYSKRNRNCYVRMNIADILIETWLPFEWELKSDFE